MRMLVLTERDGTKHCVERLSLVGDVVRFANNRARGPAEIPASEVDVELEERDAGDLGKSFDPPPSA